MSGNTNPAANRYPAINGCRINYVTSDKYVADTEASSTRAPNPCTGTPESATHNPKRRFRYSNRRRHSTRPSTKSRPPTDHIYGVPVVRTNEPMNPCPKSGKWTSRKRRATVGGCRNGTRSRHNGTTACTRCKKNGCKNRPGQKKNCNARENSRCNSGTICDPVETRRRRRKFRRQKYCNSDSDIANPSWVCM